MATKTAKVKIEPSLAKKIDQFVIEKCNDKIDPPVTLEDKIIAVLETVFRK